MAADVSSMVNSGNSEILITRDLLGELSNGSNKKLDLDLQVPKVWEMPLHLKSGMVYPERCNYSNLPLPSFTSQHHKQKRIQDPELSVSKVPPLNFLEESALELKLVNSSPCQSVCTLDKVKSALQRAEKETIKKRSSSPSLSLSPSTKLENCEDEQKNGSSSAMFAAACPGCLLYVITLKTNPKCPRCNSKVPFPLAAKKARIDLNAHHSDFSAMRLQGFFKEN